MGSAQDTYLTLGGPSEAVIYKERNSKFIGYAFPLDDESGIKTIVSRIRREHPAAGHACYAWQARTRVTSARMNDDGEPAHSAGMPIYGQIQAFGLTDVLVVVVRIYGGKKLGIGGLIRAYRTTASMALQGAQIVTRTLRQQIVLSFPYAALDTVLRVIRRQRLTIYTRKMALECSLTITVPNSRLVEVGEIFRGLKGVTVSKM
jgi:uncharacterized YigZ family protein